MSKNFVITSSVLVLLLAALLCSHPTAKPVLQPSAVQALGEARTLPRPARHQEAAQMPQSTASSSFSELVQQAISKPDPDSKRRFPQLMLQWAKTDPIAALSAWHDQGNDSLPSQGWQVEPEFYRLTFTALAKRDLNNATANLLAPDTLADRLASTQAVAKVAAAQPEQFRWLLDHPPAAEWSIAQQVLLMHANGDLAQAQDLAQYVQSPEEASELLSLMKKGYDPMQQTAK